MKESNSNNHSLREDVTHRVVVTVIAAVVITILTVLFRVIVQTTKNLIEYRRYLKAEKK